MSDAGRREAEDARRDAEIRRLHRGRPRSRFARWSGAALAALVALAWSSPGLRPGDFFSERRLANLERFLGELRPYPLQGRDFDFTVAAAWAGEVLRDSGRLRRRLSAAAGR